MDKLVETIESIGMIPIQSGTFKFSTKNEDEFYYEVVLNGKVIGYVESSEIKDLTAKLRYLKAKSTAENSNDLPKYMEICPIPKIDTDGTSPYSLYPGLYIFTTPGRMMRPVINLSTNNTEYIGTMEQVYLHICVKPEEFIENVKFFFDYLVYLKFQLIKTFLKDDNTQRNLSIRIYECNGKFDTIFRI